MTTIQQLKTTIGPFVVGEKPLSLQYQFQDENGNPLNLTGYLVKFTCKEQYGVALPLRDGSFASNGADGLVIYAWQGDEFPTPGHYIGELWVGNSTLRFASVLIEWYTRAAVGAVPPI